MSYNLDASEVTYEQAVDLFSAYCKVKNLSDNTVVWYSNQLKHLTRFMAAKHPDALPATTDISHLRGLVAEIKDRLAPKTVNDTVVAVKTFFKFFVEEGYLDKNPADRLEKIKAPKTLIQPFTDEQVRGILAQVDRKRFSGTRDYTMLLVLFDCGLRLSELLDLKMEDISFQQNTFKVFGKGAKERIVPFSRVVRFALAQYLERRGDLATSLVFVNEYGDQMTSRAFQLALHQYGKAAKITGVRCSPHTCRHTFATNWIRNGGDVFHLQRILGHSTLDICRIYVSLCTDDLQRAHVSHSPMDRMLGDVKANAGRTRIR